MPRARPAFLLSLCAIPKRKKSCQTSPGSPSYSCGEFALVDAILVAPPPIAATRPDGFSTQPAAIAVAVIAIVVVAGAVVDAYATTMVPVPTMSVSTATISSVYAWAIAAASARSVAP